jgi:hypothetical protein
MEFYADECNLKMVVRGRGGTGEERRMVWARGGGDQGGRWWQWLRIEMRTGWW